MKTYLSGAAIWLAVIGAILFPSFHEVEAADIRVTPSIRLGEGWDSNVFVTDSNEESDFYSTVTPEVKIEGGSPTLSMRFRAGMEGRWYSEHSELSSSGYSKYAQLTPIDGWKPTARLTVLPTAYFLESRNSTARRAFVVDAPTIPTLGITTLGLQKTRDFGGSLGFRYKVVPRVELGVTAFGGEHKYPSNPVGAEDSRTVGGDASVQYDFTQKSSGGLYGTGSRAEFEVTPDVRVLGTGILVSHRFSPFLRIDGRLGYAFARQEAPASGGSEKTDSDPAGIMVLMYSDNTFLAKLHGESLYSSIGRTGQITHQNHISLDLGYQVLKQWNLSVGGHYEVDRGVFALTNIRTETLNGTASVRYAPWEWGTFDLTGDATRESSDDLDFSHNRYTVSLGFTLGKTFTAF